MQQVYGHHPAEFETTDGRAAAAFRLSPNKRDGNITEGFVGAWKARSRQ
jgi:hypothetical protein